MKNNIRVIANWFLKPQAVLKDLGIKVKLDEGSDWQVLKEFDFGVLAFDYEEGLKFEVLHTKESVGGLVKFVRNFHKKHAIPFKNKSGYLFHCSLTQMYPLIPKLDQIFESAGLVRDPEFDFNWNLKK